MEEAKQILLNLFDEIAKEQRYVNYTVDVEEISAGGASMTSALFLSTIRAEGKPNLNLFSKVAIMNEVMRKQAPLACPFTTELYFYTKLHKRYERIEDKYAVLQEDRLRIPKLYGNCDKYLNETLVLENLVASGFNNFDRQQTADLEYMSTAIDLMAKLHAYSLAFYAEDPVGFREESSKLTIDISKMQVTVPLMKPKMLANALAAIEGENREKAEKFFNQEDHCPLLQFTETFQSKDLNILLHGDFKPSNLMHRRRNGKLEIVPVDFQQIIDGHPLRDLFYFIFTATDETFRRVHYHALLELYHKRLGEVLHRLHLDVEAIYPESTYKAHLKEYSMMGLTIAMAFLPMVLMEEDKLTAENAEPLDFVVEGNKLYKERLNGVINNYVEWGLL